MEETVLSINPYLNNASATCRNSNIDSPLILPKPAHAHPERLPACFPPCCIQTTLSNSSWGKY